VTCASRFLTGLVTCLATHGGMPAVTVFAMGRLSGLSPSRPVTPDRSGTGSACWKATVCRFVTTEAGVEHTFAAGQSG